MLWPRIRFLSGSEGANSEIDRLGSNILHTWLILAVAFPGGLTARETDSPQFPPQAVQKMAAQLSAKLQQSDGDPADEVHVVIGLIAHDQTAILLDGEVDETGAGAWLFPVASLTKPLTAALLAISVAKGDCRLDEPVRDDGRLETITWLDLATHRSGLPRPSDFNEDRHAYDAARMQAFLANVELSSPPGEAFRYSTVGYAVLGQELADRSGRSFERAMADEIFNPLGMSQSSIQPSAASGLSIIAGFDPEHVPVPYAFPQNVFAASGGLVTSANDLLKFLHVNMSPDPTWQRPMEVLQAVHEDRSSFPPSVMSLGWHYLRFNGTYWHSGSGPGHTAFMAFNPKRKCGVVILANVALAPRDTTLAFSAFAMLGKLGS